MKVNGQPMRTIWPLTDRCCVQIIDQTKLPHDLVIETLRSREDAAVAISDMHVRGAPLIGATAAFGFWLGMIKDASDEGVEETYNLLLKTRPTAVNLRWALDLLRPQLLSSPVSERAELALLISNGVAEQDIETNRMIGVHGLDLIREISVAKGAPVNVLTHCNAGWLATVDWGTATSPIYQAHDAGIDIHVWVDETRPRNQGASLTAWELAHHGVPHHVIVDNAGGHLMQHGKVDLVITGTDRTTASGDVCNKIGTYLKALAACDNNVPFYVALPSPTIDWTINDGLSDIPIEERAAEEVTHISGIGSQGELQTVRLTPEESPASNPAFDVTPARLVSGLITERGIVQASKQGLMSLFPEKAH